MNPKLIVLVGIPNAGKSIYRYGIEEDYKSFDKPITTICRDDIRDQYWGKSYTYSTENEKSVTAIVDNQFETAKKLKFNIIIDQTNCKEGYLDDWVRRRPEGYDLKIIFFPVNFYLACLRNVLRYTKTGKWIPWKVMKQMYDNFNKINKKKYAIYI